MTTPIKDICSTAESSQIIDFEVWKTIQLGTGLKTPGDYRKALSTTDCDIECTEEALQKLCLLASESLVEVDLVKIPTTECRTHGEIYALAKQSGLETCPVEVGVQLCIQTTEPTSIGVGGVFIGMEPIMLPTYIVTTRRHNMGEFPKVLCVSRYRGGDKRHLSMIESLPTSPWNGIYRVGSEKPAKPGEWVFIKPRK